jgi:hypothetical protein
MKLNLQVAGQNGRAGREVITGNTNLPNHTPETLFNHSGLAKQ